MRLDQIKTLLIASIDNTKLPPPIHEAPRQSGATAHTLNFSSPFLVDYFTDYFRCSDTFVKAKKYQKIASFTSSSITYRGSVNGMRLMFG